MGTLILAIVLVSAFGVGFSGFLMGHDDMGMIGCHLMNHDAALCPMSALAHIASWQNLFAAIPTYGFALSILLSMIILFGFGSYMRLWLLAVPPPAFYTLQGRIARMYDPLHLFIARGLMHPKIF